MKVELSKNLIVLFNNIADESAHDYGIDRGKVYDGLLKLAFVIKAIDERLGSDGRKGKSKAVYTPSEYQRMKEAIKALSGDYAVMAGHLLKAIEHECLPNWNEKEH